MSYDGTKGSVSNAIESTPSSSKGDVSPLSNPTPTMASPIITGPSGIIPTLQARKGSPFQPPVSRRCVMPVQEQIGVSHPPVEVENVKHHQEQNEVSMPSSEAENPLLTQAHFPEQNVKLAIAMGAIHPPKEVPKQELTENTVPLVIPGLIKNKSASTLDEVKETSNVAAPPAHLTNFAPQALPPRVHTLDSMDNTPTSPSVLDLSQMSIKQNPTAPIQSAPPPDASLPTFSRMVPGESTKGESTVQSQYQAPMVVPAMPSGRVVTGNAYPQPVSVARVKQEPNEVRSPPDGPDTGTSVDSSAGVVPPVRSETIGSEGTSTRPLPPDRREDKEGPRRDRDVWDRDLDRDRDYYPDRYRERKRNVRDYYRDESPPRSGRRPSDHRDYDSSYDERRHSRRDDDDDEDDDDDQRKYAEGKRERRQRAYRDELERYGDRDRSYRRPRDRRRDDLRDRDYHHSHFSHEDEDPYFDSRSDR